jgi:hypothetical protein
MGHTLSTVLVLALLAASPVSGQDAAALSPADVQAALADTKHPGAYEMAAFITATTPYARVVEARKAAAATLKPLVAGDVPADILTPHLVVWAQPFGIPGGGFMPPTVASPTAVVLRPKGVKDVSRAIQPVDMQTLPQTFGNAMGASWAAQTVAARFPLSVIQTSGAWEIAVVYTNGRTKTADLKKLQGKR